MIEFLFLSFFLLLLNYNKRQFFLSRECKCDTQPKINKTFLFESLSYLFSILNLKQQLKQKTKKLSYYSLIN